MVRGDNVGGENIGPERAFFGREWRCLARTRRATKRCEEYTRRVHRLTPNPQARPRLAGPKTYAALIAWHVPRPLRDKTDYENAVEIVDQLAGHELNVDQDDYLDLLSDLVAAYEEQHAKPLRRISGLEALRFILAENELAGDDLAKLLKVERSVAYRILKGSRNLTANHIRTLSRRFSVSSDLFLN